MLCYFVASEVGNTSRLFTGRSPASMLSMSSPFSAFSDRRFFTIVCTVVILCSAPQLDVSICSLRRSGMALESRILGSQHAAVALEGQLLEWCES